ncbi:MAG: hypothetical protein RIQ89_1606 [Bacteroidota bacterium]|jgi:predicted amidohydrolase YtcJ
MRYFTSFYIFLILVALGACNSTPKIDLLLINGVVYSIDKSFTIHQAVAVEGGKIIAIGTSAALSAKYDAKQIIDLEGSIVYPGFTDGHCHFFGYASDNIKCDLTGTNSFNAILDSLKIFANKHSGGWLLGRGWDQNDWAEKEFPTNETLDLLFGERPVFLLRIDGHAALVNSKALELAGVTPATKVNGGEIKLNDGKLTGLLIDNAIELVKAKIPPTADSVNTQLLIALEKECFKLGLTGVHDAGLGKDTLLLLRQLYKDKKLKIKMNAMMSDDPVTRAHFFKTGIIEDPSFTMRSMKVYGDGAMGSRGACMKHAYADKANHFGFLLHHMDHLIEMADECMEHGFQLCTHAIGDSANKVMLQIYGDHLLSVNNKRWRIEHAQVLEPADRIYFKRYSILPSVQPTHATSDMYWAESRIGATRMKHAYAYNSLEKINNIIIFGTDFPVEGIDPLHTFYAAVFRKDKKGFPADGFYSNEAVSRKEAIRAMTYWPAYASFKEHSQGSIEVGKAADFTILDTDLLKATEQEVLKAKVCYTIINGEVVYGQ